MTVCINYCSVTNHCVKNRAFLPIMEQCPDCLYAGNYDKAECPDKIAKEVKDDR